MENAQQTQKRLYKSRHVRMIDGVCGGVAEYSGVDVTLVRLIFIVMALMGGAGLVLYIAAMIIMPANPETGAPAAAAPSNGGGNGRRFWGIVLILMGAAFLFINLGWWSGFHWWSVSGTVILPILMIAAGIFIFVSMSKKGGDATGNTPEAGAGTEATTQPVRELRRSVRNRKIFGVCGGLGDYFSVDPTIVRLIFIVLIFASFGWGLLIYIALGLLMPEEKLSVQQ